MTWEKFRETLSASTRELAECAKDLDEKIARLDQLNKTWQLTLTAARQPNTPPAVLKRAQSTVDSIEATQKTAEATKANVLTIQTHLSEEQARGTNGPRISGTIAKQRSQISGREGQSAHLEPGSRFQQGLEEAVRQDIFLATYGIGRIHRATPFYFPDSRSGNSADRRRNPMDAAQNTKISGQS